MDRGVSTTALVPVGRNCGLLVPSWGDRWRSLLQQTDQLPRQLWESPDGVVWTQRPTPPIEAPLRGMEFGYATAERVEDPPASGRWRWRHWVLGDGDAWVEVVTPPAQPVAVGGDAYAWSHEVGSLLYWGYGDEDSDWLWVGRFDS